MYIDTSGVLPIQPPGIDPTVVCLIGQGIGYHTYIESVSFASGNSVMLTQKGIDPTSIVVAGYITDPSNSGQTIPHTFVVDVPGTPHDYSVTQNTTQGAANSVTTIGRETGGAIEIGNPVVTVSYKYTDTSYSALTPFDNYNSFVEAYGPAYDPLTGAISSPLTLAAQFAIQNGANFLYAIATDGVGSVETQFNTAYAKLAGNYAANVIVPIWPGVNTLSAVQGLLQDMKGLIQADAAAGFLRMAVCGLDQTYLPSPTDLATIGTSTGSSRIVIPWPNQLQVYNGVTNATVVVDGWYLAAAYAGLLASQTPQMPLTRKFPIGFIGIPSVVQQQLTPTVMNDLSASGICLTTTDRNNRLVVRHGLTSNFLGGVMEREISLVRAQDALYYLIQETLDNSGLIGTPIGAQTALNVKGVVSGALELSITNGLINGYSGLVVREQTPPAGDPTVIEVRFAYQPPWPLNYILVSFTIDTSAGTSTLTQNSLINAASIASSNSTV